MEITAAMSNETDDETHQRFQLELCRLDGARRTLAVRVADNRWRLGATTRRHASTT